MALIKLASKGHDTELVSECSGLDRLNNSERKIMKCKYSKPEVKIKLIMRCLLESLSNRNIATL